MVNETKVNDNINNNQVNKSNNKFMKFVIILILIFAIGFGTYKFGSFLFLRELSNNNNQTNSIFTRNANSNDLYIDINENISTFTVDYKVKPNIDISNLELTCKFYNSSNKLIKTKVKKLGNVKKGVQFTFSVNLSLSEIMKISKTEVFVTGGTVTIFS